MEDDLGQGSGGGVSESETLSENDNKGSGSWVDDSFEEGDDGAEIMVEIVGSDVFVDGVGVNEEDDFDPAEENKQEDKEESEVALSGAMDVSYDGGENKTGEMDLRLLESKDEKNHAFAEDLGVSDEGGENNNVGTSENKVRESELGLPELNDEKNKVAESELGFSQSKEENNNVVTSENKMGESESRLPDLCDEKVHVVTEAMDVCCEGVENKARETGLGLSMSKEVKINYVVTEAIDVLDEKEDGGQIDSATETVGVVIHEEETVKDEAVGEKDTKKQDHSDSHDDGIVNATVSETAIGEGITIKETVDEKTHQDLCDGEGTGNVCVDGVDNVVGEEAKSVCEKEDSHGIEFESNHGKTTLEEVDDVLDFKDDGSNLNQTDLRCVGNEDMETCMVHQIHVASNDVGPTQPADSFDTDVVNKDESKKVLSETKEQAEASLIITESSDHLVDKLDNNDLIPTQVVSVGPVSDTTQVSILPEMELPLDSNTVSLSEIDRKTESEAMEVSSEYSLGVDTRVCLYDANVSTQNTPKSKPSFKIGECIRRVASQLTGSAGKEEMAIDDSKKNPESQSIESFSVDQILSQLHHLSQQPKKRHTFLNMIHTFLMGFRTSISLNRKRRPEQTSAGGPTEGFEFDDMNYSELGNPKPTKPIRRRNSRKRYSDVIINSEVEDQVKRRKQASSPAELIINFSDKSCVPTEINLNKMFRRFGQLMESETEVDHESGCAKVIFKRGSDAEVARSSSEAFNVFGNVVVSYRIGYEPVVSVRVSPVKMVVPQEDINFH